METQVVAQVVDQVLLTVLEEQEMMVDLLALVPRVAVELFGSITTQVLLLFL